MRDNIWFARHASMNKLFTLWFMQHKGSVTTHKTVNHGCGERVDWENMQAVTSPNWQWIREGDSGDLAQSLCNIC